MRAVRAFAAFVYDFVIGDDPSIAVAVVVALAVTDVVAGRGATAWWILPCTVVAILGFSLMRASRR